MGITAQADLQIARTALLTLSFLGSVSVRPCRAPERSTAQVLVPAPPVLGPRNDGINGWSECLGTSFSISSKVSILQCSSKRRILRSTSYQLFLTGHNWFSRPSSACEQVNMQEKPP